MQRRLVRPLALFPIRAGSLLISTRPSHANRRFRRSFWDLRLDAAMHVRPSALRLDANADVLTPAPHSSRTGRRRC
ncbi:hypothetical protein B0H13DRAFT_2041033 [Mycena leptocephala]|nr:hypothetical protein B0H13DRAFT_2041033 [Mycena leptocephala]